jgi:hypothetical protein
MKPPTLFLATIFLLVSCASKNKISQLPIVEGKWVNCNDLDEEVEISRADKNLLIRWDNQTFYLDKKSDSLYVNNGGTITLVWKVFQPFTVKDPVMRKMIPQNLNEYRALQEKQIKEHTKAGLYDSLSKNEEWKYTITSGKWTLSGLETDSRGSFTLCDWKLYGRQYSGWK